MSKATITSRVLKLLATASFIGGLASSAFACTGAYEVQQGDMLADIAIAETGNVFSYETIYTTNQRAIGLDPSTLTEGTRLSIPCTNTSFVPLDWAVMPSVETIARLLMTTDVQVLDIRGMNDLPQGVMLGAVSVPYDNWRGPKETPDAQPSDATMTALVGAAGLDLTKPIVVVGQDGEQMNLGKAAKVYWLLKSAGASSLAVMRDGFEGWATAGLPVAQTPIRAEPQFLPVTVSATWQADVHELFGVASQQIPGHLMDAGTIGACNLINGAGKNTEAAAMRILDNLRVRNIDLAEGRVISACETAELAALSWFYASELAGLDNLVLYPEKINAGALALAEG